MNRETQRPRIALVAASLEVVGGQGVQARDLVEALRRDRHSVRFLPINRPFPRGFRWLRRFKGVRTVVNEILFVPSLWRIASVDVVHVFAGAYWSFLLAAVPAMITGRLSGKHVVLHYHSGEADDHLEHWGALVHPWLSLAHAIVVPSAYLRGVFARHGYDAEAVPNIVDVSAFAYRDRTRLAPKLLSTRNLEPYYRVDTIVEAFARIRQAVPSATLTIAGYGSDESRLRELAASCGGDAIRFAGKVDPAGMPRLYAEHDVFLNASVLDNQPVSILEAFASGLPIVSTAAGDIPNMLRDGDLGQLIPFCDPVAMAEAVVNIMRHPEPAIRRARLARQAVNDYTWHAVSPTWQAIYSRRSSFHEIVLRAGAR